MPLRALAKHEDAVSSPVLVGKIWQVLHSHTRFVSRCFNIRNHLRSGLGVCFEPAHGRDKRSRPVPFHLEKSRLKAGRADHNGGTGGKCPAMLGCLEDGTTVFQKQLFFKTVFRQVWVPLASQHGTGELTGGRPSSTTRLFRGSSLICRGSSCGRSRWLKKESSGGTTRLCLGYTI